MPTPDGGDSPPRALLVAVAAMAAVALLVGLAIGVAVLSVAKFAGVGGSDGSSGGGGEETLVIPKYQPTETVDADLGLPSPSANDKKEKRKPKPSRQPDTIQLFVAPQSVGPGERINFNGVYDGAEGASLQIQRKENGAWTDFPVTATVRGGTFSTWIQTSRTGTWQFRVYDAAADRGSNPVKVTVG